MKKKCKRKVYPKINTIEWVKTKINPVDQEFLNKIRLRELASLESIVKGNGTIQDWRELNYLLNFAEIMGENGIGPEVLEVCKVAEEELIKSAKHYEKTKNMLLSGVGIQAIRDLIEFAQLQQSAVTAEIYDKMLVKTTQEIKRRGKNVVELK